MCMDVFASMYVCVPSVCSGHREQKKVLDPSELELQMVVSLHVGAGNRALVCKKSSTGIKGMCHHTWPIFSF